MYVFCDMQTDQGGWIVIQKRIDGSVGFHRNWNEYKRGFGDKLSDYWLGLDIIHSLTSQGDYTLRIDMEDFAGSVRYAEYNKFVIGDEKDNFRLTVDQYSGDAGDTLRLHNNAQFSTKDRDNDNSRTHCAKSFKGGWWFNRCLHCNLNGEYFSDLSKAPRRQGEGILWSEWKLWEILKRVEMKIRLKIN
ncbi:ryncolin-1-like [Exaiptasia diaphana]|uniref:Fibrinogen C-terminal domain-containing protein n=1 Tax=Exaiptasia diaphana TaxID=2652724 RepID=A0A913Y2Z9_EXADI|nr:ryncolin-1-like [Exaiptasia diaphana]